MKVHLRKRLGQLSEFNESKGKKLMASLYLAYKQKTGGKTNYRWLNLQVFVKPKNNLEKDHNKETMILAEAVRAKMLIDLQTSTHGFVSSVKSKISFIDYFEKLTLKRAEESNGNGGNWKSTLEHLKIFCEKNDFTLEQIDDVFLDSFKEYLLKAKKCKASGKLSQNSAQSYFNKVKAALREAYRNKMIKSNPSTAVSGIKSQDTSRKFLSLDELKKLSLIYCENPLLKQAFLFSALTGLRWSDVKQVCWNKIHYTEADGYSIHYIQQKTKKHEVLPISGSAINILPEKNASNQSEPIFKDLKYHSWMNKLLQNWVTDAGINKKITFHCARHSFATLHLTLNTDIYTVSKLLGHRHLKTTEIYAKIVDAKKIEAVSKLNAYTF